MKHNLFSSFVFEYLLAESTWSILAPLSRSSSKQFGYAIAWCNAVIPLSSGLSTWAPFSIKNAATSLCPFRTAKCNGAAPLLSALFRLAWCANNCLTHSRWPLKHALWSGVPFLWSWWCFSRSRQMGIICFWVVEEWIFFFGFFGKNV